MRQQRNLRIYIDNKLKKSELIEVSEDLSHYLCNVMRCNKGDTIKCFNSYDGEYLCQIVNIDKKKTEIKVDKELAKPQDVPDIWLLFAPLKKDKTDFVIEKAVELGVKKIFPVITSYTNTEKVRRERFLSQAKEAAEQCGRFDIPEISAEVKLSQVLGEWDNNRVLFFMDEIRQGKPIAEQFLKHSSKKAAILIGPEGGFSDDERRLLNQQSYVVNVNLGPRILRAETAAAASLAIWQSLCGDWKKND